MRALVFLAPIVVSYLTVRAAAPGIWGPAGLTGMIVRLAQIAVIGTAAALLTERVVRKILPLSSLLNMTLVFPDRAPSRFGLALRAGNLKKLRQRAEGLPADRQEAAEELVAMVVALGRHERLTRGHTERVRAYADLIAEELELTDSDRELLSWGAMVHDIGKLTVPPEILNGAGKPTDEEWAILRAHPQAGADMVEPLADWLGEWRLAAGQHHERWDGKGYPNGLVGEAIGLAGRIVAVADAYDVITSARSYKKAMPAEAAREEMVRCAGGQFDPEVVRALLQASLVQGRSQLGFLGWLNEIFSIPRGLSQMATATMTTGAVVVAASTGGLITTTDAEPDQLAMVIETTTTVSALGQRGGNSEFAVRSTTPATVGGVGVTSQPESASAELMNLAIDTTTSTDTTDPDTSTTSSAPGQTTASTSASTMVSTSTSTTSPANNNTTTTMATTASPQTTAGPTTTAAPATTTTAPTTTAAPTTTTTTAPATTTTMATTTTLPPVAPGYGLGSPGTGNAVSQALLPIGGYLETGALPNYDTDRDSDPGLMIQKGAGMSETDLTKMQRWSVAAGGEHVVGTITVNLWAAIKDFDTGKTGRFLVGLYDCNAAATSCSMLRSNSGQFSQSAFGANFGQATLNLGTLDHTFAADRYLLIKVATTNTSADDLWFAYGTTDYPSHVIIE